MPEQKEGKYIWMSEKGLKWVKSEKATVHVLTHALHYGDAVFEGIRCYQTSDNRLAIFRLDDHIHRLFNSAKLYDIFPVPCGEKVVCELCKKAVQKNGLKDAYIRPMIYRGRGGLGVSALNCPVELMVSAIPYTPYLGQDAVEKGIDAQFSPFRRPTRGTAYSMAKASGLYLNSILIKHTAQRCGFAEGIALDENGFVAEGSGENIFFVIRREIYTPPVNASILAGITRDSVITIAKKLGLKIREEPVPPDYLRIADEIFLTGTWAEITPVRTVDKILIGNGQRGKFTETLQKKFALITTGQLVSETYEKWLSYI